MDDFETYISEFCAWARQRPRKERELKEDWVNDYHIDTCAVDDREWSYETAIECKWFNGGNWVIVRGYETKEDAEVGHSTWCNKAKTGFNKLYDVYEDRIYCKEKAENLKPIETISYTKRCRFVCPLCHTEVNVSRPLRDIETSDVRCPMCKETLILTECEIEDYSYPTRVRKELVGIR